MPIRVPTYEQVVAPREGTAPSIPALPTPPPAAFGGDVAAANAQTGQIVSGLGEKLGEHMIAMQREQQENKILEADTNYRKDLQNVLYDPTPNDDGIPNGLLNRNLSQAHGISTEYDAKAAALKEKYLGEAASPFETESLGKMIDQSYSSMRDNVISHEARQRNENNRNVIDANLQQRVSDAGLLKNPKDLIQAIKEGSYVTYAGLKRLGYDDQTIATKVDKFSGEMAKSAIETVVASNPYAAQGYYNQIKNQLSPGQQTDLQKFILTSQRQFEELIKYQKEQVYDTNMRTAMIDMFDGKMTLSEAQRLYREDGIKKSDYDLIEGKLVKPDYELLRKIRFSDSQAYNEIRDAQLQRSKTPGEIDRMIAQGNVDGKITNEDSKFLTQINKDAPPDPRDTRVNSQASSVRDFGNRYFSEGLFSRVFKKGEKAKEVEGLVSDFYKRVDKEQAQGPRIDEIAHDVIAEHVKKENPEINRLEDIPHVIVGIDGSIRRVLNPDQSTKLKPRYKIVPVQVSEPPKPKVKKE